MIDPMLAAKLKQRLLDLKRTIKEVMNALKDDKK